MRTFEIDAGQSDLAKVILACRSAACFARCLDGGEQERDEDADNGNDDQEFNEGERVCPSARRRGASNDE
jgi:hypothetical protein